MVRESAQPRAAGRGLSRGVLLKVVFLQNRQMFRGHVKLGGHDPRLAVLFKNISANVNKLPFVNDTRAILINLGEDKFQVHIAVLVHHPGAPEALVLFEQLHELGAIQTPALFGADERQGTEQRD